MMKHYNNLSIYYKDGGLLDMLKKIEQIEVFS